jgi:hypothetical protein
MDPKCLSRSIIVIPIIFIAVMLAGCSGDGESIFGEPESNSWSQRLFSWDSEASVVQSGKLAPGAYAVDPLFQDFYQAMGGEEVLGPAISPSQRSESKTRQYTESSLMVFDPLEPLSTRFKLAPLGNSLGVAGGDLLGNASGGGRIINGRLVIPDFLAVYESLGGARFVGRPISEALFNAEKQRLEQYFENLGFYRLQGQSKVHFMPYGAYACDRNCRKQNLVAGIPSRQPILPDHFIKKTLELGLPLVGKPLTGLHLAPDGKQEVIFENLVLVADTESPHQVGIRPIAEQIGGHAQALAQPQESDLSLFIEVEDGMGYNVPIYFVDFLESSGGMQIAGQPISEVFSPEPGLYWQCFTNLCLQFNMNAEGDQRLQLVPLGVDYKSEAFEQVRDYSESLKLANIDLKVWEKDTFVSSRDTQEIHTAVYEDGKPLQNFEPLLIATMPDGSQRKAYFQPSDEHGCSAIKLAPIEAPNGTLIAYQVCLFGVDGEQTCVGDNYLIWDAE